MKITCNYCVHWMMVLSEPTDLFFSLSTEDISWNSNDVIFRVLEGGIFTQIQKRVFDKHKTKYNSPTFADTYSAISISHLQTVFYLLLLGYVLAFASFVAEIMWHRCWAKRR